MRRTRSLRLTITWWVIACFAGVDLIATVDVPHVGRWKLDPGRSDFGEVTLAFAQTPSGSIRISVNGGPFSTSQLDGQDRPTHSGYTSSWRQVDNQTWSAVTKLNGQLVSTNQFRLSSDRHTLTMTSTGPRTDGTTFHDTLTYVRTSKEPDLIGLWKGKNAPPSQEQIIEFVRRDDDGLTLLFPAIHGACEAKLDGRDYPLTGPTMPSGATMSLTRTGPRSIRMVQKQGPQTIAASTLTVSSDGTTLTESVQGRENGLTMKKTYDRQQ
jgi:hypothetical protein